MGSPDIFMPEHVSVKQDIPRNFLKNFVVNDQSVVHLVAFLRLLPNHFSDLELWGIGLKSCMVCRFAISATCLIKEHN